MSDNNIKQNKINKVQQCVKCSYLLHAATPYILSVGDNGKTELVNNMKKWTLVILTIFTSVLTFIFSLTLFNRIRMNYNTEGNYFDENSAVVYHEQAVFVYGILAFVSLLVTTLTIWRLKVNLKK